MTSFEEYGRPRRVAGGLTARTARGAIGEHWWSKRFVTVLESFALGTRLTRGRTYARQGQVLSLDVAAGAVTARVQGSRRTPYAVRIGLAPFPELVWAKVEVALAEQALCSAQLLAGEMPPELEDILAGAGARLFPSRLAELAMSCSCPDFAVPCKHIAASFYLLAESFDDDPFRILHWRGRERAALLARLRELRGGGPAGTSNRAPRPVGAAAALVGVRVPGELSAGSGVLVSSSLWEALPLPPLPVHPELPADLLLRQLPAPPSVVGGRTLVEKLHELYVKLAADDGARSVASQPGPW